MERPAYYNYRLINFFFFFSSSSSSSVADPDLSYGFPRIDREEHPTNIAPVSLLYPRDKLLVVSRSTGISIYSNVACV
jgi:hypothetical protein